MAEIIPDFTEAFDNDTPIVDGTYNVRVVGSEQKVSKKGGQYISWNLNIFGAEGDFSKFNNRSLYHTTMLAGPGAGMLKQFWKAATGEVPETGVALDTDVLMGKELAVTLTGGFMPDGTVSRWPNVKSVSAIN